jgi:hypothetical protein
MYTTEYTTDCYFLPYVAYVAISVNVLYDTLQLFAEIRVRIRRDFHSIAVFKARASEYVCVD